MPVTLGQIIDAKKSLKVRFIIGEGEDEHEEIVNTIYKPSSFTPALETEINKLGAESETMGAPLLKMLSGVKSEANPEPKGLIVDWDIMMDPVDASSNDPLLRDPQPFPPTFENLGLMPFVTLGIILRAVTSDLSPKAKSTRS